MRIGITGANGFIGTHLTRMLNKPIVFEGNLTDIDAVREFVSKCDRIYHLAGKNRDEQGAILKNNLISTSNLVFSMMLEEAYPELIFASSQQVEWNGNSEYGFTKALEEEIVQKALKWCIFRIPNVYGPGCKPFYNSVIATFCYQIAKGESVVIHDPSVKREFIYIDDLIQELLYPEFNEYKFPKGEIMTIGEVYSLLIDKSSSHKNLENCLLYASNKVD